MLLKVNCKDQQLKKIIPNVTLWTNAPPHRTSLTMQQWAQLPSVCSCFFATALHRGSLYRVDLSRPRPKPRGDRARFELKTKTWRHKKWTNISSVLFCIVIRGGRPRKKTPEGTLKISSGQLGVRKREGLCLLFFFRVFSWGRDQGLCQVMA